MFSAINNAICLALSAAICFTSSITGLWTDQLKSVQSIHQVTDGFYTMDYTYDYDIDDMLEHGIDTHVELLTYGITNTMSPMKGFACTSFNAVNKNRETIFARNFDYMDSPSMLVWTHPKNGYASISTVSLYFLLYNDKFLPSDEFRSVLTMLVPYACMDGMNEKGLSIAILELEKLPTFQVSKKPNLTTSTMVRAVLDKAATVDEAIEIFQSHDMRDFLFAACTYHYQITDASGDTAVIEYVNGKMNVLRPEHKKGYYADSLVAANYYLTEGVRDPHGAGHDRAEKATEALKSCKGKMSETKAMKTLSQVAMDNEDLNGYLCSTIWSEVYNNHDLTVDVCVNRDYKNVYHYSVKNPPKYK